MEKASQQFRKYVGGKLFLVALSACLISAFASSPAFARTAKKSTIKIVKQHFAASLGLNLENVALNEKMPTLDLVSDLYMDRGKVYYALVDLYEKWGIRHGDTELTHIGKIALYLEKHSPKLKKKKRSLLRGLGFGGGNEAAVERPAPVSAPTRSTRSVSTEKRKTSYVQTVFYATNRRETGDSNPENFYNGERALDGKMNYGIAKVNIPLTHKKGHMEMPFMGYSYLRSEKSHIYLRELDNINEASFFSALNAKPGWKGTEKDLLVYVHGFNVDFEEAIRRAGQIAFDFNFAGTPIAFSWPSEGETTSYNSDREDAIYSAKYLETFLEKLNTKYPGRKIHIIAHSMGNQALLHGLRLMASKNKKKRFASVILAAPDFDAELFTQQISQEIRELSASWTIYASKNDYALWASKNYNSVKRLGTPLSIVNGYQIIDASEIQVTPWNLAENHSYYATKKVVLDDMIQVLKGILPGKRGLVVSGEVWKFKLP